MRRKITAEQEQALQLPVLNALDDYFDATNTMDASFCSVGCGATSEHPDMVLAFTAFRVPREEVEFVRSFLTSQAQQFADGITSINEAPDFTDTTH